ncbi:MAG: BlaI/MecI/CopY family transcriptional regulator [Porphyromonas sp.]|nr:BlaI/MecI/CopY family transcriptional regulator [Porphyromonas sp.]
MSNKEFLNGLTPIEEDFMRALWNIGEGEISDAIKQMEHSDTPYTTIASIVGKLEEKKYVHKVGKRRGHLYAPLISREDYYGRTLKYVVSNFFTGSYKSMVQYFARNEKVTREDIEEILRMIDEEE